MPRELKLLLGLAGLMVLSMPIGLDPGDELRGFIDEFLKVLLIFILMINVVTSFQRLRQLLEVTVLCGTVIAIGTLVRVRAGTNLADGFRAQGIVGGIFGNPNDLALALNILLPIAIGLALTRPGPVCQGSLLELHRGCSALAVLATYSRAGFLTICRASAACLAFRLRRRYPALLAAGVAGRR